MRINPPCWCFPILLRQHWVKRKCSNSNCPNPSYIPRCEVMVGWLVRWFRMVGYLIGDAGRLGVEILVWLEILWEVWSEIFYWILLRFLVLILDFTYLKFNKNRFVLRAILGGKKSAPESFKAAGRTIMKGHAVDLHVDGSEIQRALTSGCGIDIPVFIGF